MSTLKQPRPLGSIHIERPTYVNLISEESASDADRSFSTLQKCGAGHTFLPKKAGAPCPFCCNLLRKYQEFASSKGGSLISTFVSDFIVFRCHRTDHKEFSLTANSIRANKGLWCPMCTRNHRSVSSLDVGAGRPTATERDREKRRFAQIVEENKRDQAKLLSSAKQLYKLTTGPRSSPVSDVPIGVRARISEETSVDRKRHPDLPEEVCKLVRSVIACEDKPSYGWSLIAAALDVPASTEKEKLFRRAAKVVHPDKCKHPQSDEAFKILNAFMHSGPN